MKTLIIKRANVSVLKRPVRVIPNPDEDTREEPEKSV